MAEEASSQNAATGAKATSKLTTKQAVKGIVDSVVFVPRDAADGMASCLVGSLFSPDVNEDGAGRARGFRLDLDLRTAEHFAIRVRRNFATATATRMFLGGSDSRIDIYSLETLGQLINTREYPCPVDSPVTVRALTTDGRIGAAAIRRWPGYEVDAWKLDGTKTDDSYAATLILSHVHPRLEVMALKDLSRYYAVLEKWGLCTYDETKLEIVDKEATFLGLAHDEEWLVVGTPFTAQIFHLPTKKLFPKLESPLEEGSPLTFVGACIATCIQREGVKGKGIAVRILVAIRIEDDSRLLLWEQTIRDGKSERADMSVRYVDVLG